MLLIAVVVNVDVFLHVSADVVYVDVYVVVYIVVDVVLGSGVFTIGHESIKIFPISFDGSFPHVLISEVAEVAHAKLLTPLWSYPI